MATDGLDPLVGTELAGRYQLNALSRETTLARVYNGVDLQTGAWVTIKVLDPRWQGNDDAAFRFRMEARALAMLQQPNIPRVLDMGAHRDLLPFTVTERHEGESLRSFLRAEAPLPLLRTCQIGAQVARAIAAAHAKELLHRAVSADSVFLLDNAEHGDFVSVPDFDDALVGMDDTVEVPGPNGFVGHTECLAPEYIARGEATEAGDVYALGVVLYQLLCGRAPFTGPDGVVVDDHVRTQADPPNVHIDVKGTWLDALVMRMLSKQPEDRPTAFDVVLELQRGSGSALEPPPLLPVGLVPKRVRPPTPVPLAIPRPTIEDEDQSLVSIGALLVVVFAVGLVVLIAWQLASLSGL